MPLVVLAPPCADVVLVVSVVLWPPAPVAVVPVVELLPARVTSLPQAPATRANVARIARGLRVRARMEAPSGRVRGREHGSDFTLELKNARDGSSVVVRKARDAPT